MPALKKVESLQVSGAFNRTKEKAEKFAETAGFDKSKVFDSLDELVNDPSIDAVDALVPVGNNLPTIKKAIDAGKSIAIEKPISANLEDAKEIVKLDRSTDLPIIILENFVYHNGVKKLKELLPKIGKVVTFLYQSTGPYTPSKYHATAWRRNPEHIGGYLSDGGVHQLAVLTEVLGEVESVSARTTQLREVAGDVDTLNALFNMKSGAFGTFTYASYLGATKKTNKFTIFGTTGSLIYENNPGSGPTIIFQEGADGKSATEPETIQVTPEQHNGIEKEFQNFADAVKAKDKSLIECPPSKAFHHFAIIVACVVSGQNAAQVTKVETV